MHAIRIETNAYVIDLVCHDLRVTRLAVGDPHNEFLIRVFDELAGAERARDEYVGRGHHQHYWVIEQHAGSRDRGDDPLRAGN